MKSPEEVADELTGWSSHPTLKTSIAAVIRARDEEHRAEVQELVRIETIQANEAAEKAIERADRLAEECGAWRERNKYPLGPWNNSLVDAQAAVDSHRDLEDKA